MVYVADIGNGGMENKLSTLTSSMSIITKSCDVLGPSCNTLHSGYATSTYGKRIQDDKCTQADTKGKYQRPLMIVIDTNTSLATDGNKMNAYNIVEVRGGVLVFVMSYVFSDNKPYIKRFLIWCAKLNKRHNIIAIFTLETKLWLVLADYTFEIHVDIQGAH